MTHQVKVADAPGVLLSKRRPEKQPGTSRCCQSPCRETSEQQQLTLLKKVVGSRLGPPEGSTKLLFFSLIWATSVLPVAQITWKAKSPNNEDIHPSGIVSNSSIHSPARHSSPAVMTLHSNAWSFISPVACTEAYGTLLHRCASARGCVAGSLTLGIDWGDSVEIVLPRTETFSTASSKIADGCW